MIEEKKAVVVLGAGIAGIKAALDLAESGVKVYLIDRSPSIGGTLVQLDKWFPDGHCGMCKVLPIFARDDSSQFCLRRGLIHPNIEVLPLTLVEKVDGEAGHFSITLKSVPSGVNPELCIGCGLCAEACSIDVPSEFDEGLGNRKAIYLSNPWMYSRAYTIDWNACTKCEACVSKCPTNAIDLSEQEALKEIQAGAIILSVGFEEFDPRLATQYGHRRYPNVITSIELERLISPGGPTEGELVRLSDQRSPKSIAFLQCVGSRDTKRDYCSAACCMYALKEAILIKEACPDTNIEIFLMDMRAFGKGYYRYYQRAVEMGIKLTRCRVPAVRQDFRTNDLLIKAVAEDGSLTEKRFELVVLSVGQAPSPQFRELSETLGIELNSWGFCQTSEVLPTQTNRKGIYVCGSASGPKDIADSMIEAGAAADKASQLVLPSRQALVLQEYEAGSEDDDPRTAIFLCSCGNEVSSVLDMYDLAESCKVLPSVLYVGELQYLCQRDAMEGVKAKIAEHRANRVVLGACSPLASKKSSEAIGIDDSLVQVVGLREDVAWSSGDRGKSATEKAKAIMAMAVERLRLQTPSSLSEIETSQAALVVGGGLAGMVSALSIAEREFEVHIVERELQLGGNVRDIYSTVHGNDVQALLKDTIQKVENNTYIHIHKETEVTDVGGFVGNFDVELTRKDGDQSSIQVGSIIVATGGEEYQPTEYLCGEDERVVTQHDFEGKLIAGNMSGVKSVAMIQCVGSREDYRPYCSRVCCAQALKNALHLKEQNPDTEVVILYRDMMSYGFIEQFYSLAREKGVIFIRYDLENKPQVKLEGGRLKVQAIEPALCEQITLEPDLLVLSSAIVPREQEKLAQILDLEFTEDGFFKEANVKFRPVDFLRDGIFLCGLAHSPRSIGETLAQAQAAGQRASSILLREKLYSGRMVSEVNERRCVGCEICVSVCPFGARVKDEEGGIVVVREALCQGCGACAVACPSGAATIRGFSDTQIFSMMDVAV